MHRLSNGITWSGDSDMAMARAFRVWVCFVLSLLTEELDASRGTLIQPDAGEGTVVHGAKLVTIKIDPKLVKQSSTADGAVAARAVDGNSHGSCAKVTECLSHAALVGES